ncbi:uncharacterized protein BT62DRAFT_1009842 [Guyanagaster necrorhizus]|uniref:Uncharacterized protein n=1 Tax=Guyanagaster necrorhizus TaxID=856835 RepID=A0A9P7VLU8_9AGAR|nr:uncharacterized protein BT62DRAFT_1009842 [Guyanagaster necrorhizus MCA 3950]KAG7442842.1 hypothetical protein BT62DRAFT_1009842 [Guyanagaster necrorhizus MCA 3950]
MSGNWRCSEPSTCLPWKNSPSNFSGRPGNAEDTFHDFLERSSSPIKKLKLALNTHYIDFTRTFDMAFRVTQLDIALPSPIAAISFFRALVPIRDGNGVLPELQSLKANYSRKNSHTYYITTPLDNSRMSLRTRLEDVSDLPDHFSTKDEKGSKSNHRDGGQTTRPVIRHFDLYG